MPGQRVQAELRVEDPEVRGAAVEVHVHCLASNRDWREVFDIAGLRRVCDAPGPASTVAEFGYASRWRRGGG
jgi:hypothetical protein